MLVAGRSSPQTLTGCPSGRWRGLIEVLSDRIITEVYQENGWVRKNFYYPEECTTEELFQGKWKQSQQPSKKRARGER